MRTPPSAQRKLSRRRSARQEDACSPQPTRRLTRRTTSPAARALESARSRGTRPHSSSGSGGRNRHTVGARRCRHSDAMIEAGSMTRPGSSTGPVGPENPIAPTPRADPAGELVRPSPMRAGLRAQLRADLPALTDRHPTRCRGLADEHRSRQLRLPGGSCGAARRGAARRPNDQCQRTKRAVTRARPRRAPGALGPRCSTRRTRAADAGRASRRG